MFGEESVPELSVAVEEGVPCFEGGERVMGWRLCPSLAGRLRRRVLCLCGDCEAELEECDLLSQRGFAPSCSCCPQLRGHFSLLLRPYMTRVCYPR